MTALTEERIFKIRRNLSDAGCDAPLIEKFLSLEQRQRRKEQYQLLSKHKAQLLEELHQEQYKIDCLDHMVYSMQKEDEKRMEDSENGRKIDFNRRMGQNISAE